MDGGDVGDGAQAEGHDVCGCHDRHRQPSRLHEAPEALPQLQARLREVQLIQPLRVVTFIKLNPSGIIPHGFHFTSETGHVLTPGLGCLVCGSLTACEGREAVLNG